MELPHKEWQLAYGPPDGRLFDAKVNVDDYYPQTDHIAPWNIGEACLNFVRNSVRGFSDYRKVMKYSVKGASVVNEVLIVHTSGVL